MLSSNIFNMMCVKFIFNIHNHYCFKFLILFPFSYDLHKMCLQEPMSSQKQSFIKGTCEPKSYGRA